MFIYEFPIEVTRGQSVGCRQNTTTLVHLNSIWSQSNYKALKLTFDLLFPFAESLSESSVNSRSGADPGSFFG